MTGKQRRREQAVAALLSTPTIAEAAKVAGTSERTLRRWLDGDAGFAADYDAARRRAVESAIANLQQAANEAVLTLRRNLAAEAPAAQQVRSAIALLDFALKAREQEAVLGRLDALERVLGRLRPQQSNGKTPSWVGT
jgi:hypothetical protein